MNFEKYTDRARGFVQSAQSLAMRDGHQQFTPEHLLKVLLEDDQGLAAGLIDKAGGRSRDALTANDLALGKLPKVEGSGAGQVYITPDLARLFDNAEKIAEKSGRFLCDGRAAAARPHHGKEFRTPPRFSRKPASRRRTSTRRSRNCARAALPTTRPPKTPMTR